MDDITEIVESVINSMVRSNVERSENADEIDSFSSTKILSSVDDHRIDPVGTICTVETNETRTMTTNKNETVQACPVTPKTNAKKKRDEASSKKKKRSVDSGKQSTNSVVEEILDLSTTTSKRTKKSSDAVVVDEKPESSPSKKSKIDTNGECGGSTTGESSKKPKSSKKRKRDVSGDRTVDDQPGPLAKHRRSDETLPASSKSGKKKKNVVASSEDSPSTAAYPMDTVQAQASLDLSMKKPPARKSVHTRKITFETSNSNHIGDVDLVDVRAHEQMKKDGRGNTPFRRPGPAKVLVLALRAIKQQRILVGESRSLSANVHVKQNALNDVGIHVYGSDVLEVNYGRSFFDDKNGGMTVVVRNLTQQPLDYEVDDVYGYVEFRSLNDSLKLSTSCDAWTNHGNDESSQKSSSVFVNGADN